MYVCVYLMSNPTDGMEIFPSFFSDSVGSGNVLSYAARNVWRELSEVHDAFISVVAIS